MAKKCLSLYGKVVNPAPTFLDFLDDVITLRDDVDNVKGRKSMK